MKSQWFTAFQTSFGIKLWAIAYGYSLFCALVLQTVVLPLIPGLHAGNGLLVGDAYVFHNFAVAWAEQIAQQGWGAWSFFGTTETSGNVSLLAAFYAVFGPNPISFLPLSAAFHALGSVLLYALYCRLTHFRFKSAGVASAFTFLVFPSAMVWYAQNHKDTFLIVGYLLTLLGFLDVWRSTDAKALFKGFAVLLVGMSIVAWMRPLMLQIYFLSLVAPALLVFIFRFFKPAETPWTSTLKLFIALLAVGFLAKVLFVQSPYTDLTRFDRPILLNGQEWEWTPTPGVPSALDSKLEAMSKLRAHFLQSGLERGARSIVDSDRIPSNAVEFIAYLPRAALIGLFGPFPRFWAETVSAPRVVAAAETLIFYLLIPGLAFLLWRHSSPAIWVVLISAVAVITLQSYVSPNLGTLHRIRYGQWMVLAAMGFAGYAHIFARRFELAGQSMGQSSLKLGALVTGMATLGVLALLVRDLILVNRLGFSHALDFYYLVLLVPMLLVNALCVPLADPFTAEFVKCDSVDARQRLLNHLILFTTIVLFLLAIMIVVGWWFLNSDTVNSDISVVALAASLLALSGLTLTGNSLLNASGAALRSSMFQLLVPASVLFALALNHVPQLQVQVALGAMVVGQVLNITAIAFHLRGLGYEFRLGNVRQLSLETRLIKNSIWVMLCALLIGLAGPLNLWFIQFYGEGSVSTWSLATKLTQISIGIGSVVLSTVFVPYVAKLVSDNENTSAEKGLKVCLVIGLVGGFLGLVMVFVFANPLLKSAMPGQFGTSQYDQLLLTVKFGALQLPFISVYLLLSKMNTVKDIPKLAAYSALLGLVLNFAMNIILGRIFGFNGIVYSWTLSCILSTTALLLLTLRDRNRN